MVLFLMPLRSGAQEVFNATPVGQTYNTKLNKAFRKYSLFHINTAAISQYLKANNKNTATITLELPGYASLPLSLYERDILSNDYKLIVGTENGNEIYPKPACMTYAGHLANDNSSNVWLTITNDIISGTIAQKDRQYYIEPLTGFDRQASANTFVVYEAQDVIPHTGIACILTEAQQQKQRVADNSASNRGAGTATGTCKMVEVAIASDDSMLYKYNTVAAVQQRNISVWNVVVGVYSNAQINTQYLEFKIVGQYVSTTVANNPLTPNYAGNDANILLTNFRAWGQAGNFGFTYDIASLMTTRDIAAGGSNGVVGLAYVAATCTQYKYQLIEDFTGNISQQASCIAHETGHNLGASHDGNGDPFIMAPSIGNPPNTSFSPASVSSIYANITTGGGGNCFSPCNATLPEARFNASSSGICTGGSIIFTDYSFGEVTSRLWAFTGGSIASSTAASPSLTYTTTGLKTITLTVTNSLGSSSITKTIFVGNVPSTSCFSTSAPDIEKPVVLAFNLADINHADQFFYTQGHYTDASCTDLTELLPGTTYTTRIRVGLNQPPYNLTGKPYLFIDYNNDGDFLDAGESLLAAPTCGQGFVNYQFTTPTTPPVTNAWLHLRLVVMSCTQAVVPTGCVNPSNAQVQDYSVYFKQPSPLPVTLISFSGYAQTGKNELLWQTASESNNDHYEVERSLDGATSFAAIGKVASVGNSNSLKEYRFTDNLFNVFKSDAFYYRLKMVAKDGSFKYSNTIQIMTRSTDRGAVVLYPNPVASGGTLQISTTREAPATVSIYNNLGQLMYSTMTAGNGRSILIPIPSTWASGLYVVRVLDDKGGFVRQVMVR